MAVLGCSTTSEASIVELTLTKHISLQAVRILFLAGVFVIYGFSKAGVH